jgi:hypothetical protein
VKAGCRRTALAFAVAGALSAVAGSPHDPGTLARLARIAALYHDSALGFACQETIEYHGEESGRIRFAYIFTHEDGRLRDFRTWKTGTTAAQRGAEVDPEDYRVPRYLASAYLWAFVFRADRQPLHAFFNLGDDEALGRSAVKIGFQPKGEIQKGLNDWAGVAWIDRETSQILKVEAWTPENWNRHAKRDADLAAAPKRGPRWESDWYDIESVVTEFSVVKNGMRFPGKVTITRTQSRVSGGKRDFPLVEHEILRVTQEYSDYEFFSVRTAEQIDHFMAGDEPLPAGR